MKVKRLAIAAVAIILVAAIALLMLTPASDDRTETEKLVLTASDLAGMNATQHSEPYPNPHHPVLHYGGSEASESDFSLTVDGWYLNVQCLLVLYNSSSSASQRFQGIGFDSNYIEVDAGDWCYMGGQYNETFGTSQVMRVNIDAAVLQNDTIAYFVFMAHPPGGLEGVPPPQVVDAMEAIIGAQVDKIRQDA